MGKLIVVSDGSIINCDLKISSQFSQPVFMLGNRFTTPTPPTNEVKFSVPLTPTNQQIIDSHFKTNNYRVGLVSNYKKDLIYIMNDNNGYHIHGFFVTDLRCSNYGNPTIDVEGQCDHFTMDINIIDNEFKRMLRKKKLERICNG